MRTQPTAILISLVLGTTALAACGPAGDALPGDASGAGASDAGAPETADPDAGAPETADPDAGAADTSAAAANPQEGAHPQDAAGEPPALEGTQWLLVQLGDETVVPEGPQGEPSLLLDADGLRATGTGGCNQFTGTYTLQQEAGELRFSPLAATRRMCPEGMDTEAAFFDALGRVRSYTQTGANVELHDAGGALVARFEPDA